MKTRLEIQMRGVSIKIMDRLYKIIKRKLIKTPK